MSPPVLHGEVLPSKRGASVEELAFEDMRDTCPSTPYIGRGRWAAVKRWFARVWSRLFG